jgi:hypothetical protein
MKPTDIQALLRMLVAEGEVTRVAVKVLSTTGADSTTFEPLFRAEVDLLVEKANRNDPREWHLRTLMEAARNRLLGHSGNTTAVH